MRPESTATPLLGPLFRLPSAWVKLDVCASEPSTNASVWLQSFASERRSRFSLDVG
jgi:hypothetical protein